MNVPLLAASLLAAAAVQADRPNDRIEALIKDRLAAVPDGGLVMVILGGESGRTIARGKAPAGTLDADTPFDAGGIVDAFIGVALADMVAKGELALGDPVAKHLAGVPVPTRNDKSITLEDLALHRSGLPRVLPGLSRSDSTRLASYTRDRLSAFLEGHELTRDIGAQYQRSLLGTALLAAAMSARSGTSIEALLENRVFAPLGLRATRFVDGVLRSTANDLSAFARANLRSEGPLAGRLGDARSSRGTVGQLREGVGLGWRIRTAGTRDVAWISGAAGGNQAFLAVEPGADRAVVILHTHPLGVDEVGFSVLEELHEVSTAADPALLASFAGEYEMRRGLMVVVRVEGRKLVVKVGDEPESTLTQDEGVRFTFDDSDSRITFVRDASGATLGLMLHRGSQHTAARKMR